MNPGDNAMTPQPKIDQDRLRKLDSLVLGHGKHKTRKAGMCALEAVAWLAGEPHSDTPECVSPVIAAFARRWNDDLDAAGRQRLKPCLPMMIGTRGSAALETRRAWLITDWLVRHQTPAWLDLAGCAEQATALRGLPEIVSAAACRSAQPRIDEARKMADAARDAAREKLEPTVVSLQASAFGLLDRLVEEAERPEEQR